MIRATFGPDGLVDHSPAEKLPAGPAAREYEILPDIFAEFATNEPTTQGGPTNDNCTSATVIPGNVVNYNPPLLNTTDALVGFCDALEDCEVNGAGTNHTVWYRYTPNQDGRIFISTVGSNYDTVLSVFDGCRSGTLPPCGPNPTQLACNDNQIFGNQQATLSLDVEAGETYIIKVGAYHLSNGTGGTLDFSLTYSPPNDACNNATRISGSAFNPPQLSTHNATTEICEALESCELNNVGVSNSVYYVFQPPCDGLISINTNGSTYDTVLSVWDGCGMFVGVDLPCDLPTQIACDDDAGIGTQSQLLNVPVQGGNEYYIKVSDYNTAQGGGFLDFNFIFDGAATPEAGLNTPQSLDCVCNNVPITGTAAAGGDSYAGWSLEYRAQTAASWTEIASGSTPILSSTLANWNTTGLQGGYYFLRLTVENACGETNTAVQFVYLDKAFNTLDVRAPQNAGIFGGVVCLDGTVFDLCPDLYTVDYRALPSGSFQPVDPGNPVFSTNVTNDPLVPGGWNTILAGVPDGNYQLRVSAVDQCANTAEILRTIVVDNTPPTAAITSPVDCDVVAGMVQIIGTANDANLRAWNLQVTDGMGGWMPINSGNTPIVNGVLGTLDTSALEACSYAIRLLVSDFSVINCDDNHLSEYVVTVDFAGAGLVGDMNCDGAITVSDIGAFVLALTNPPAYAMQYPDCNINHADTNGDNAITVSDIGPFIALITG